MNDGLRSRVGERRTTQDFPLAYCHLPIARRSVGETDRLGLDTHLTAFVDSCPLERGLAGEPLSQIPSARYASRKSSCRYISPGHVTSIDMSKGTQVVPIKGRKQQPPQKGHAALPKRIIMRRLEAANPEKNAPSPGENVNRCYSTDK
ncbi:hypothetical protein EVAR_22771_1 [Eumeta japonica]|uniref:Uncharacterized protein n=1 Tax=Eumeta variegata TaxID=151549 RepID=A0A4C1USH6_EUMVA|nr:hypothetical protein EVAR_22771_1 [Eumeta japonica]